MRTPREIADDLEHQADMLAISPDGFGEVLLREAAEALERLSAQNTRLRGAIQECLDSYQFTSDGDSYDCSMLEDALVSSLETEAKS